MKQIPALSVAELEEIEARCAAARPGPWTASLEGRDHQSGSDIIMIGPDGARLDDIELVGATPADYDFIAAARTDVPRLIDEIRRLRAPEEKDAGDQQP